MKKIHVLSVATRPKLQTNDLVADNIRTMSRIIERAKPLDLDFILFPEIAMHVGFSAPFPCQLAEPMTGPWMQEACRLAKSSNTHLIWPYLERAGNRVYNTVALIGREGKLIGQYRKYYLTPDEMNLGIQPGDGISVFDTDCGRVGLAICFDIHFPEIGLGLARQSARIVFWPSMFEGGRRLQSWAQDYGYAMVACSGVAIVDSTGSIVADRQSQPRLHPDEDLSEATFATLNLDRKTYHLDDHEQKLAEIQRKYGDRISVWRHDPEGTFVLQSNVEGLDVESIEQEFELVDLRTYLDRAMAQRTKC